MQVPLVSVEMITYNHEPYIRNAIERILAQKTTFPFELVIGEDCSTDGTREIVSAYAAQHKGVIRVITSGSNVGMKENANRARRACRGKYIAYCEGDDYWHRDDKLQLQVDYLENHPECGLVCSDYDLFDARTNVRICNYRLKSSKYSVPSPNINDILSGKANILNCTVVTRRELVEKLSEADPYLHQSGSFKMGDTQLWAELSLQADIFAFGESFATYYRLEESASQSNDRKKRLRFWISNSEMCLYLCDKHHLSLELRRGHVGDWVQNSLQLAFLEKNSELAETVRGKASEFPLRNWIWYMGAKQRALRPLVWLLMGSLRRGV